MVYVELNFHTLDLRIIRKRFQEGNEGNMVNIFEIFESFHGTLGITTPYILYNCTNHGEFLSWKSLVFGLLMGAEFVELEGLILNLVLWIPLGDKPWLLVTCWRSSSICLSVEGLKAFINC